MKTHPGERGSAAVEFALVVPILVMLVLGIAEFGRAYSVQMRLSGAAREGVREMALHNSPSNARTTTKAAASELGITDAQIAISPTSCVIVGTNPAPTVRLTITYPLPYLTGFFGTSVTLTGQAAMRCNG